MLKKFTEGLVFGCGFGISFIAISYTAAYFIYPMFVGSQIERSVSKQLSNTGADKLPSISDYTTELEKTGKPFHELGIEDQLKEASVMLLAKYEAAPDGKMKAIIKEFLKKEPGVTIY